MLKPQSRLGTRRAMTPNDIRRLVHGEMSERDINEHLQQHKEHRLRQTSRVVSSSTPKLRCSDRLRKQLLEEEAESRAKAELEEITKMLPPFQESERAELCQLGREVAMREAINVAEAALELELNQSRAQERNTITYQLDRFVNLTRETDRTVKGGEDEETLLKMREIRKTPPAELVPSRTVERYHARQSSDVGNYGLSILTSQRWRDAKVLTDADIHKYGDTSEMLTSKANVYQALHSREDASRDYVNQNLRSWAGGVLSKLDKTDEFDAVLTEIQSTLRNPSELSADNVDDVIERLNLQLTDEEYKSMFTKLDPRGKGKVRVAEFQEFWNKSEILQKRRLLPKNVALAAFDEAMPPPPGQETNMKPMQFHQFLKFLERVGAKSDPEDVAPAFSELQPLTRTRFFTDPIFHEIQVLVHQIKRQGQEQLNDVALARRLHELDAKSAAADHDHEVFLQSADVSMKAQHRLEGIHEKLKQQSEAAQAIMKMLPKKTFYSLMVQTDVTIDDSLSELWESVATQTRCAEIMHGHVEMPNALEAKEQRIAYLSQQLRERNNEIVQLRLKLEATNAKWKSSERVAEAEKQVQEAEITMLKEQVEHLSNGPGANVLGEGCVTMDWGDEVHSMMANLRQKLRLQTADHNSALTAVLKDVNAAKERAETAEQRVVVLEHRLDTIQADTKDEIATLQQEVKSRDEMLSGHLNRVAELEMQRTIYLVRNETLTNDLTAAEQKAAAAAEHVDRLSKLQKNMILRDECDRKIEEAVANMKMELRAEKELKARFLEEVSETKKESQRQKRHALEGQADLEQAVSSQRMRLNRLELLLGQVGDTVHQVAVKWLCSLQEFRNLIRDAPSLEVGMRQLTTLTSSNLSSFQTAIGAIAKDGAYSFAEKLLEKAKAEASKDLVMPPDPHQQELHELRIKVRSLESRQAEDQLTLSNMAEKAEKVDDACEDFTEQVLAATSDISRMITLSDAHAVEDFEPEVEKMTSSTHPWGHVLRSLQNMVTDAQTALVRLHRGEGSHPADLPSPTSSADPGSPRSHVQKQGVASVVAGELTAEAFARQVNDVETILWNLRRMVGIQAKELEVAGQRRKVLKEARRPISLILQLTVLKIRERTACARAPQKVALVRQSFLRRRLTVFKRLAPALVDWFVALCEHAKTQRQRTGESQQQQISDQQKKIEKLSTRLNQLTEQVKKNPDAAGGDLAAGSEKDEIIAELESDVKKMRLELFDTKNELGSAEDEIRLLKSRLNVMTLMKDEAENTATTLKNQQQAARQDQGEETKKMQPETPSATSSRRSSAASSTAGFGKPAAKITAVKGSAGSKDKKPSSRPVCLTDKCTNTEKMSPLLMRTVGSQAALLAPLHADVTTSMSVQGTSNPSSTPSSPRGFSASTRSESQPAAVKSQQRTSAGLKRPPSTGVPLPMSPKNTFSDVAAQVTPRAVQGRGIQVGDSSLAQPKSKHESTDAPGGEQEETEGNSGESTVDHGRSERERDEDSSTDPSTQEKLEGKPHHERKISAQQSKKISHITNSTVQTDPVELFPAARRPTASFGTSMTPIASPLVPPITDKTKKKPTAVNQQAAESSKQKTQHPQQEGKSHGVVATMKAGKSSSLRKDDAAGKTATLRGELEPNDPAVKPPSTGNMSPFTSNLNSVPPRPGTGTGSRPPSGRSLPPLPSRPHTPLVPAGHGGSPERPRTTAVAPHEFDDFSLLYPSDGVGSRPLSRQQAASVVQPSDVIWSAPRTIISPRARAFVHRKLYPLNRVTLEVIDMYHRKIVPFETIDALLEGIDPALRKRFHDRQQKLGVHRRDGGRGAEDIHREVPGARLVLQACFSAMQFSTFSTMADAHFRQQGLDLPGECHLQSAFNMLVACGVFLLTGNIVGPLVSLDPASAFADAFAMKQLREAMTADRSDAVSPVEGDGLFDAPVRTIHRPPSGSIRRPFSARSSTASTGTIGMAGENEGEIEPTAILHDPLTQDVVEENEEDNVYDNVEPAKATTTSRIGRQPPIAPTSSVYEVPETRPKKLSKQSYEEVLSRVEEQHRILAETRGMLNETHTRVIQKEKEQKPK